MRINNRWTVAVVLSLAALAPRARALAQRPPQIPSTQLQQMLLQNPELIRQRIRESGLTAAQIRARLRAEGYPDNLLDSYLDDSFTMDSSMMEMSYGSPLSSILGLERSMPLDTGLIRSRDRSTSNVFGVNVFKRASTKFLPVLAGPVPPD